MLQLLDEPLRAQVSNICNQCNVRNCASIYTLHKLSAKLQSTYFQFIRYFSWRRGVVASVVRRMNEVTLRRARLVLGWVTVFGRVYHHGM